MKLLFDRNLAPSLVRRLAAEFPDSAHTFTVGLGEADERDIWAYAREHGFAIVSKDSDFHQLSVREGPPRGSGSATARWTRWKRSCELG